MLHYTETECLAQAVDDLFAAPSKEATGTAAPAKRRMRRVTAARKPRQKPPRAKPGLRPYLEEQRPEHYAG